MNNYEHDSPFSLLLETVTVYCPNPECLHVSYRLEIIKTAIIAPINLRSGNFSRNFFRSAVVSLFKLPKMNGKK